MFADPKKVGVRRLRRRLKAGASIALALVAGAFLACKGGGDAPGPAPSGPDARPGPKATSDTGTADVDAGASQAAASGPDAGAADAAAEAADGGPDDAGTALMVRDGGVDAGKRVPRVDKREHRKGMPVRDNLLE